jgi:hexosaminidase
VAFVKKVLDLMAVYKLNVLHWHLTEDQVRLTAALKAFSSPFLVVFKCSIDLTQQSPHNPTLQGWRIEIKSLPRLTEFGAWRGRDDQKSGGFYTQDEVSMCAC